MKKRKLGENDEQADDYEGRDFELEKSGGGKNGRDFRPSGTEDLGEPEEDFGLNIADSADENIGAGASDEDLADESVDESVAKRKVIYIEIDDEVTDVFEKVRKISGRHVYIVAPQRAILFQSIVNLKILKRKSKNEKKKISFITNDENGIYLAGRLGIAVYDKVNAGKAPSLFSAEINDEKLRITPLKASVNSIEEEAPTRLTERKISISEILKKNRGNKAFDVKKLSLPPKPKTQKESRRPKFTISSPNKHAFFALLGIAVVILLVVIYVALPGATVYLTPAASVLEKSVNITLLDSQKNAGILSGKSNHTIASFPIATTFEKSITHFATGKKFSERGSHASGKIKIFNNSSAAWPLIENTRFQTEAGIVFRVGESVTVPPANASGVGSLEVLVKADPVDAFGAVVGERGNIGPSKFFLPGLREDSRSKVYAESFAPMTGGVTDFMVFVTEQDLKAAESRMRDELIKGAEVALAEALEQRLIEQKQRGDFVLLEGGGTVQLSEPLVALPPGLKDQQLSEFIATGTIQVSGVYYSRDEMVAILKDELAVKKSPQKELIKINEQSTTYRIFEWNEAEGRIKVTANIKGIEQYAIDPGKENGARLLEKIRAHIVGLDIKEAKVYIQNLPEINKVEIESWPFWSPTIPNFRDNIDFEIRGA